MVWFFNHTLWIKKIPIVVHLVNVQVFQTCKDQEKLVFYIELLENTRSVSIVVIATIVFTVG